MNSKASAALSSGLAAHKAGHLAEARRFYEAALALDPNSPDLLHLYGVLLGAMGDGTRGAAMLRRAVALKPGFAAAHFNLGCLLLRNHQPLEAESALRHALAVQPQFPEALLNLANLLLLRGQLEEAIDRLEKAVAINPRLADAHHSLGTAHEQAGRTTEAVDAYAAAARLRPDALDALLAFADRLLRRQAYPDAVEAYRRAIVLDPSRIGAHCNLGNALKALRRLPEAEESYRAALRLKPDSAPILNNLGIVVQEQKRVDEAITLFQAAIAADPAYGEAYISLAPALQLKNRLDEAADACLKALHAEPGNADAHCNLGNVRMAQNRLPEAIAEFERSVSMDPARAAFAKNLSHALLANGDFKRGWQHYEARWGATMKEGMRSFQQQARWSGREPVQGKTLFIHAEQGLGDTLQFMRYVPLLAARGARIVFEVQESLFDLLQDFEGVDRLIVRGAPVPEFDLHCPLLSLPDALGTELTTIPAGIPYLQPDVARTTRWKTRLEGISNKPKIGVAWAGNPNHGNDHNRSVPFETFARLLECKNATFVPLQKEARPSEREAIAKCGFAFDPSVELASFSDTAALVAGLDGVITVDTSVAHLAGALGRPTWILLPFAPDWRWMLDRRDSPWYPTARLYRQPAPGDWDTPIAELLGSLASNG